ncbi:MAG: hypothetical protein OEO79_18015 [Gemmatimonadota bacterium]|nr:hypothetical protein [Gemmatimonadota bacterium]
MSVVEWAQVLGSIGEFVGAIVVVATLLYLTRQVRIGSRQLQQQAHLSSTEQFIRFLELVAGSEQVSNVWAKGRDATADLTPAETLQFELLVSLGLSGVEYHLRASEDPDNDPDTPTWASIIGYYLAFPDAAGYWAQHRQHFYPEFAEWVEREVSLPKPTPSVSGVSASATAP